MASTDHKTQLRHKAMAARSEIRGHQRQAATARAAHHAFSRLKYTSGIVGLYQAFRDEIHPDEIAERLHAIIRKRVKGKGGTAKIEDEAQPPEEAATNVVDFMALLKQSLDAKKRTPAKKTAAKRTRAAKKAPAKKAPAKKAAKKAAPRRKAG